MGRLGTTIKARRALRLLVTLPCALGVAAGLATVGGSAPTPEAKKHATVVYVVARSGSMGTSAGACGSRIACVTSAIAAVNAATNGRSTIAWTGLATANPTLASRDVDLGTAGMQLLVKPKHDGNTNGRADLADALGRVSLGGTTCYACGLQAARAAFATSTAPSARKVLVFLADRPNVAGDRLDTLAAAFGADTEIRAVALGPRATCEAERVKVGRGGRTEVWVGSLAPVAALAPGGTCVHTNDFAGIAALITAAIG